MPYTPSPVLSTYSSQKLPLVFTLEFPPNTDGFGYGVTSNVCDKGAGMRNVLPVKEGDQLVAYTRPSLTTQQMQASGDICRGVYVWNKTASNTYYFIATGSFLYSSPDGITFTAKVGLGSSGNGRVGFTEFISDVGTKYLMCADGVMLRRITDNVTITNASAGYPTPHVPMPVFMDGYIFLAESATGDIYNSNLNVPGTWTAGDFISSELYPDDIVGLVKINNYILAIGTTGCEFFYDAANPTASPLARVDGQSLPFGCGIVDSIAVNKNACVLIANTNDGESKLRVIEDFKFTDIDTGPILPYINALLTSGTITRDQIKGSLVRINGDLLYLLNTYAGPSTTTTRATPSFAFSFGTKMWVELTAGDFPFPVTQSMFTDTNHITNYVAGNNPIDGTCFFGRWAGSGQSITSGNYIASDFVTDMSAVTTSGPITQELRSPNLDFDTLNRKALHKVGARVYASNKASLSTLTNYNISVSYSDDDFQNWSTARDLSIRPLSTTSLTTNPVDFPFLTQLGTFRQRSMKLSYIGKAFLKWVNLELDINKGQQ